MAVPVKWHDTAVLAYEQGVRLTVEMPPGSVLTKLSAAALPEALSVPASHSARRHVVRVDGARAPYLGQALLGQRQTEASASRFGSRSRERRKLSPMVWRIRNFGCTGISCTL